MKILNLIHVMVAQAFYSWAMREINPLHPDLPRIMLRQKELADKVQLEAPLFEKIVRDAKIVIQ